MMTCLRMSAADTGATCTVRDVRNPKPTHASTGDFSRPSGALVVPSLHFADGGTATTNKNCPFSGTLSSTSVH